MTTIANFLRINAQRYPAREALVFGDVRIRYQEYDSRVDRIVSSLLSLGLKEGDRVAVLATNSHRYVELQYVLARAGLVLVPINALLSETDILYLVNDSRPRAFFFDPGYKETWDHLRKSTDCIDISVSFDGHFDDAVPYDDLLADTKRLSSSGHAIRAILYTSGTTGTPKGCVCSHAQLVASLSNFLLEIPLPRDRPFLLMLPAFTGAGAYLCGGIGYLGGSCVILPRFDPALVLDTVVKEGIGHFFGVPTMLLAIAREQERMARDISSLQIVGYGGAVISPGQIEQVRAAVSCDLYQFFGSTETGGAITFLTPEDHRGSGHEKGRKRLWSCGRPSLFAEIKVVDDDGIELGTDQDGEFVVRSPANIIEYANRPADTLELFKGGWLHTGEIVRKDVDGYIYIVDRKKDIIRTGGINVAPSEVEGRLHEHPAVLMAAVIGVPDPHYTEAVKAVVKLRDGASASEAELIAFVRASLAGYKTPKSVDFVDALPLNSSGKVLKRVLREKYWQGGRRAAIACADTAGAPASLGDHSFKRGTQT